MNENCQKHDLDSPQQHHKMQEINDDSSSSASSTPSGSIINHTPSEVNSECSFAMGDGVWQTRQSDTEPQVQVDFLLRHMKLRTEKIKIARSVRSLITGQAHQPSLRSLKSKYYIVKDAKYWTRPNINTQLQILAPMHYSKRLVENPGLHSRMFLPKTFSIPVNSVIHETFNSHKKFSFPFQQSL